MASVGIPLAGVAVPAITGNSANTAAGKSFWSQFPSRSYEDYIFVVLGFILIAVGLLSFKQAQQIVSFGGKVAKAGAE